MTVEIWSDVMCPFCYIGKRKFEKALAQFGQRDQVEVIWKSFQLDPASVTDPSLNPIDHLAAKKGWSKAEALQATEHVTTIARDAGLDFRLENAVVANSFDAHRLSHLAKEKGKQDSLEEKLFAAYFTEGKNTADHPTLTALSMEAGLQQRDVEHLLNSQQYADEVTQDIEQAHRIGVRGVPFFVFDRRYAVSGAQEPHVFLKALDSAYSDRVKEHPQENQSSQNSDNTCGPDGCEV